MVRRDEERILGLHVGEREAGGNLIGTEIHGREDVLRLGSCHAFTLSALDRPSWTSRPQRALIERRLKRVKRPGSRGELRLLQAGMA